MRQLERMEQLDPEQPTRFGERRTPRHLYLIVERKEWSSNAEKYLPVGRSPSQGVPLCDLDRLDSVAARKYFLIEYKQASAKLDEMGFVARAADSVYTSLNKVSAFFSSAPVTVTKLLNGQRLLVDGSVSGGPPPSSNSLNDGVRVNGKHTSITEQGEHIVRSPTHSLIVLHTKTMISRDLAWDSGQLTRDYPRLTRAILMCADLWAEFPLCYDTKKLIVALPDPQELQRAFEKAQSVVDGVERATK